MNHALIFLISFIVDCVFTEITHFLISPPTERYSYELGDKVNLTCIEDGKQTLSVLLRHNDKHQSENGFCLSDSMKYKCVKEVTKGNLLRYTFSIDKLSWEDGGEWFCVQGGAVLKAVIAIRVVGTVQSVMAQLHHNSDIRGVAIVPEMLYGKGLRTNPFDLTRGATVRLTCSTGCSTPISSHSWTYQNMSIEPRALVGVNHTVDKCAIGPDGSGLVTRSSVLLDCNTPAMIGSIEVFCRLNGSLSVRSVFVLCPGGHRPWTLTSGEIIGISVSVAVAALMLLMFIVSARRVVATYRYGPVGKGVRV